MERRKTNKPAKGAFDAYVSLLGCLCEYATSITFSKKRLLWRELLCRGSSVADISSRLLQRVVGRYSYASWPSRVPMNIQIFSPTHAFSINSPLPCKYRIVGALHALLVSATHLRLWSSWCRDDPS